MPLRLPNTIAKRLGYVLRQYRDPGVLYWTTRTALEIQGIHDVTVPTEPAALRAFVQKLEPRLGTNPYEKYLPWVAQQLNKRAKQREGLGQIGLQLARRLRAIAEWAEAEGVDLGRVDAAKAIAEAQEYEADLEDEIPQGDIILEFPDGYTAQELKTGEELDAEGVAMQHCVGSYCDAVEAERVNIFSIRDPSGNPHVTIEYNPRSKEIVHIRGKQNDEPAERYWPYVGALIENLGARKYPEPPQQVLDEIQRVYDYAQEVESSAESANQFMTDALRAFKNARYHDALEFADQASSLEHAYGDDPVTGPLLAEIKDAVEAMKGDEKQPLDELPEGKKHRLHQEFIEEIEDAYDDHHEDWTGLEWDTPIVVYQDHGEEIVFPVDGSIFEDVEDYDDLRKVSVEVAVSMGLIEESEDLDKYVQATERHDWGRAANPRAPTRAARSHRHKPQIRQASISGSRLRGLKRRLTSL